MTGRDPRFFNNALPATIDLPDVPVGNILKGAARKYGDRNALIFHDFNISYTDLYKESLKLANALQDLGYGKGDVLSTYLPNSIQYVIAYYGILLSGATYSAINPFMPVSEVLHQIQDTNTAAIIAHTSCAKNLADQAATLSLKDVIVTGVEEIDGVNGRTAAEQYSADWYSLNELKSRFEAKELSIDFAPCEDIAHISYTGGTTGKAKGVLSTHFNFVSNCLASSASMGMLPDMDEHGGVTVKAYTSDEVFLKEYAVLPGTGVIMSPAPLYHISGLMGSVGVATVQGATLVLIDQFHPITFIENIEKYKVTQLAGAPQLYNTLLVMPSLHTTDLSSVRNVGSGAAPMSAEMQRKLQKVFPNALVSEGYGLTEATGACIQTVAFKSGIREPGSIGLPIYNTEVKLVPVDGSGEEEVPPGEKGEIWIRGPQVAKGYLHDKEASNETFSNGWLRTGDIAVRSEGGILTIVDRKKDMLIYNGYNIYPRQLEELLYEHEAVQSCVVIGVPDDAVGERTKAFVVLKPGITASLEEIQEFVNSRVVHYAKIREIKQLTELPMTAAGKISRIALQKLEASKAN
ncbi:class I adenylate-forming enzyme family protein [Lysinibacillus odysseyi]|uniref:class I adenylate-forming enzyme family protein n=1 Tax=Lysinibacillus odysseyi TaxID=202611 RepID=UPI00068A5FB6|nr:AMP-binding protein [Lysinibacillus odysseyi]